MNPKLQKNIEKKYDSMASNANKARQLILNQNSQKPQNTQSKKAMDTSFSLQKFKKIIQQQDQFYGQKQQGVINPNFKYVWGEFSQYAVKKQKQSNQLRLLIDKTIKQAIKSHLQQVQAVMKSQNQFQAKAQSIQNKLKARFNGDSSLIYKFLQNPIETFMEMKPYGDLRTYLQQFTQILLQTYKLSIIDGKLATINDLRMDQALKDKQNLYLPTAFNDKTYVKIGQNFEPTYIFFSQGKLKTRSQLTAFNAQQKQIMINMVRSFLQHKGIIISQVQLQQNIKQMIKQRILQTNKSQKT